MSRIVISPMFHDRDARVKFHVYRNAMTFRQPTILLLHVLEEDNASHFEKYFPEPRYNPIQPFQKSMGWTCMDIVKRCCLVWILDSFNDQERVIPRQVLASLCSRAATLDPHGDTHLLEILCLYQELYPDDSHLDYINTLQARYRLAIASYDKSVLCHPPFNCCQGYANASREERGKVHRMLIGNSKFCTEQYQRAFPKKSKPVSYDKITGTPILVRQIRDRLEAFTAVSSDSTLSIQFPQYVLDASKGLQRLVDRAQAMKAPFEKITCEECGWTDADTKLWLQLTTPLARK